MLRRVARWWMVAFLLGGLGCPADVPDPNGDDDTGGDDDSVDPLEDLPPCAGGVLAAFDQEAIAPPWSGSDGYQPADGPGRAALAGSIQALIDLDAATAQDQAAAAGYELCAGEGAEQALALWRPEAAGTGRALVTWRADPSAAPLLVETPHPYYDLGTLAEGVAIFDELGARALIASGTHRCASTEATPCDGSSSVCTGQSAPYRRSDMAHVTDSGFQAAHEVLAGAQPGDWVLNVHGMSGDGVSLSDGTTGDATAVDAVALVGAALMAAFPAEPVTSCNPWPGAVVDERLCGTTNTQGRHVNGAADPCEDAATAASGRFVHMEQSPAVRAEQALVIGALAAALEEYD